MNFKCRTHGLLPRRVADRLLPGRCQSDRRRRRRRRAHLVHGRVGAAADDAHVLAGAGGSGHIDVSVVGAGNVQDEARWIQRGRRVVRSADSSRDHRHRSSARTRGFPARAFGSTRRTLTCGTSSAETMTSGEFSVEVEGLRPNGPDHKLKIFSMSDTTGDTTDQQLSR